MPAVAKVSFSLSWFALASLALVGCSTPPKANVPALTPENAAALLRNNPKAETWITYIKKQNPACGYQLMLPDQVTQPTSIDLSHIVMCGGSPSPKEFDASVSFAYDKDAQKWVITRFAS
jgi:hypothetical protein